MEIECNDCRSCHKYAFCSGNIDPACATSLGDIDNLEPGALRTCQRAISELYYTKIHDKGILEVGCGTKEKGGFLKSIVEKNNCRWIGIDIKKTDLSTYVCSVGSMPFEDDCFDWVIGSQTLEHWKKPKKALREIHRVLKPDGKVSLTAPIHLHGEKMFVRGDFDRIEKLFPKSGFRIEKFESWRKNHNDLPAAYPNDYAKKKLRKAGMTNYDKLKMYIIHCVLMKDGGR